MSITSAPKIGPLTSLRFFAAAAIVISHAKGHFACLDGVDDRLVLSQGVTFFFVLSGFILALVYPSLTSRAQVFSYLVKRIARIWPLHITVMLLRLVMLPACLWTMIGPIPQSFPVLCNACLLQAWVPLAEFCFSANPVSWTISTELFFYLCLPWLLVLSSRSRSLPIATTAGIAIVWIALCNLFRLPAINMISPSLQTMLYVNPAARLVEFAVGVAAAFLFRDHVTKWKLNKLSCTAAEVSVLALTATLMWHTKAIAGALGSIRLIGSAGGFWLGQTGVVILPFVLMVLVFARNGGLLSSFLSLPLFVLLGEISYAIYLFHHPLLSFHSVYLAQHRSLLDWTIFVGILLASSFLLYLVVETPFRKLGANLARRIWKSPQSAISGARLSLDRSQSYSEQLKTRV
jgi:peptidoglycan/LPS O-acetylase OafA/YrhL